MVVLFHLTVKFNLMSFVQTSKLTLNNEQVKEQVVWENQMQSVHSMWGINIMNTRTAVTEGNPSCPSQGRDSCTVCSHDDTAQIYVSPVKSEITLLQASTLCSGKHIQQSQGSNLVITNACHWFDWKTEGKWWTEKKSDWKCARERKNAMVRDSNE